MAANEGVSSMVRFRIRPRVSESARIGPFRFRVSEPLGRGRVWGSVGLRAGRRGWLSLSTPLGKAKVKARGRGRRWR
jgi:hypothetical protein